jgi:selenocysteine lyase/cysteine desulfurase
VNADRFPGVVAAAAGGRVLADNAAGAQLPDTALERMARFARYENAQQGGIFARNIATSELVAEAKSEFADLIGVAHENVGIGPNATTLAIAFSRLLASTIARGDRIVVTAADHEANIAPWVWLRRFGAQLDIVGVDQRGDLDESKFFAYLERGPRLVALPWASNALGTVYDVARYAAAAKRAGALVAVDAVQACPHFPLFITEAIDFAIFSAYKMYAPHFGFWYLSGNAMHRYMRADDDYTPGGHPRYWTLETGTQSYEALAGWLGTVAYLREVAETPRHALGAFARHEAELSAHARALFAERRERVLLYGRPPEADRLPVFAFNVAGMGGDELARRLERAGIEARVGDYYAPRLMRALASEAGGRAVRLSFAHYNTAAEIDRCFAAIDEALEGDAEDAPPEGLPLFETASATGDGGS